MGLRNSSEKQSEKDVTAPKTNLPHLSTKAENPLKKSESVNSKKRSKPKPCKTTDKNEGEPWYFTHI